MNTLPPPRVPTVDEIRDAAARIRPAAIRTPLLRLEGTTDPEIWLKLESLQPINAFKLRGAMAAITALSPEERARGVWTVSAGNAGQGVAYAARSTGVPATVVAIDTAPDNKLDRMRDLGATVVEAPYEECWTALEERSFPGVDGAFIHPFDDHEFIAGNATLGLEILEDLPETAVVGAAVGGGGLSSGVGAAVKGLSTGVDPNEDPPEDAPVRVVGVEPATASPAARSYERGEPERDPDWEESFVDGAGGKSLFPRMWKRMRRVVDEIEVVSLDRVEAAMGVLATNTRIVTEGAGALPVAAALDGQLGDEGPVVAVVSGGNIDMDSFAEHAAFDESIR